MFSPPTVILDCGSSRTALGIFRCTRGRLQWVASAQETFATPVENDAQWFEATHAALLALRSQFPRSGPVGLVIPGHLVLLKLIPTPRAAPRQRQKILRFAAQQHLPYALEDVGWDGVVVGAHDQVQEVLLAAAKLEVIEPFCALVQSAGFVPQWVLPSPLATLAGYRLAKPNSAESTVVLNLGARSTSLLLLTDGVGALRTLPFGGNQLTRHLPERAAGELGEAAERQPAPGGLRLAADATEAFVARLTQEISRTIDNHSRQTAAAPPARIFITGGSARIAGLIPALTARLNMPVELLPVGTAVEFAGRPQSPDAAAESGVLTDLIGAAATQLLPDHPVLNLLPPRRRLETRNRRRQPWLLAAALLLVAALMPPLLHEHRLTEAARTRLATWEQALAPLRVQAAKNEAKLRKIAAGREGVAQLQGLADRRTSWLELFADLQTGLGQVEDVWLDRLQVVPAPIAAPLQLSLTGRMLNRATPRSPLGPENAARLKALFQAIEQVPGLTVAPTGRHFDHSQAGITQFEFIVVVDPTHPL